MSVGGQNGQIELLAPDGHNDLSEVQGKSVPALDQHGEMIRTEYSETS